MQRLWIIHLIFLMDSDQLKDTTIMISISFLVFILCRTTGSKPNLPRSDLLLEGKLNSRTKFRGAGHGSCLSIWYIKQKKCPAKYLNFFWLKGG